MIAKRNTEVVTLQHLDAEIIGGPTLSSQGMLKQEASTAPLKGAVLKTGMLLCTQK